MQVFAIKTVTKRSLGWARRLAISRLFGSGSFSYVFILCEEREKRAVSDEEIQPLE